MAPTKRSRAKKQPSRKSQSRQTTLGTFAAPSPSQQQQPASVSSSTRRSARSIVPEPSLATVPAGGKVPKVRRKPEKQAILQLQHVAVSPSDQPRKSPNFAVVIYVSKKKDPQTVTPADSGSWFQPGDPLDIDYENAEDEFTQPPGDKGKGKEVAYIARDLDGARETTDDDVVIISSNSSVSGRDRETKSSARKHLQVDDDDSDEVTAPPPKKQRRPKSHRQPEAEPRKSNQETDDDDDGPLTPARWRKTSKGLGKQKGKQIVDLKQTTQPEESAEEKDLEEDMSFLNTGQQRVLSSRTRNSSSAKKKDFMKKLAELRAKKNGKQIQPEANGSDPVPRRALYDTDDEDDQTEDDEANDDDDDDDDDDGGGVSSSGEDLSWIVDDGGQGDIGGPDTQIPIQFTNLSHQSERQNFKSVCLWIVQCILNPDFPVEDEISLFAIQALDRKMDSYGGSVLQSSAWKAHFMRAMRARPVFETESCDERSMCDACGKSNRPANHAVSFNGPRYDKDTLEDLEGEDAEDSDDSAGLSIPHSDTKFYLGRFCHMRARLSHAFIHWKKQLRDAIKSILEEKGYLSPLWVKKAARMSVTERTRWANAIADDLGNQIKDFYRDLKRGLIDAQENMTNQRGGKWR